MDNDKAKRPQTEQGPASSDKQQWQEPKLTFIEPKLTQRGDLKQVTGQFFSGFTP